MKPEPSNQAEELIEQAKAASRSEEWDRALALYDRAGTVPGLLQSPEGTCQWARVQINRGVIFHRLGRMPQARDSWIAALRPPEVPGLGFLQCVASGYMLGLSDRSRPEWLQGWKQVLTRYAGHGDTRIPSRLFEFFFAREWEFDGFRPGLKPFFLTMAGHWNGLDLPSLKEAAWVYRSLPEEEKGRVLPFWETADISWFRILWGEQVPWQLFEPEARGLLSLKLPGLTTHIPGRWQGVRTAAKWPEESSSSFISSGIRALGPGNPPFALFDDGRRAYGSAILETGGTFLDQTVRGGRWAGIRKKEPDLLITGGSGKEENLKMPEPLRLAALDSRGFWTVLGESGALYTGSRETPDPGVPPLAGGWKKLFSFSGGLLAWSTQGELYFHDGQGEWISGILGAGQVLWLDAHPDRDLVALGFGAWVEVWNLEGARPEKIARSPEPWDQGRWGSGALAVWSPKHWGSYSLESGTWTREESPAVLHGVWMLPEGPAFSDRKGRWKVGNGPWRRAHGNWVNGMASGVGETLWTGDLDGQLVQWSSRGTVTGTWGPAPALSADWLDDNSFFTLHPCFLKIWNTRGEETGFYGHPCSITSVHREGSQIRIGDTEGILTSLDFRGRKTGQADPGLGGITALASGPGGLGAGGAGGGWGVWESSGRWQEWGKEGITALVPWQDGWVTGDRTGMLKYWKQPGSPQTWPEVHRAEVMSLVVRGEELYSAGADGRVLVWSGDGHLDQILRREKSAVWDLKPAGRVLLGRTEDRDLLAWNLPGTGGFRKGEGHRLVLTTLDVHPGLQFCITGGAEGWIRIWALPDLSPLVRLDLGESVARVKISPSGRRVLACSAKGSWKIWDLDPLKPSVSPPEGLPKP